MTAASPGPSRRAGAVRPFRVMEILERAQALARTGRDVIHLEVGELDFAPPPPVVRQALAALQRGDTRYTDSLGIPELRAAIAESYGDAGVAPGRVAVNSGTSPLLLLALAAVLDPGDEVLVADPGYACYPNFAAVLGARVRPVPLDPAAGFRPDPAAFAAAIGDRTRAILVNTPANPTGVALTAGELAALADLGPWLLVDEIYRGLEYGDGGPSPSVLALDRPNVIAVDGFSKRYAMTGFRLGYGVFPEALVPAIQAMQQNVIISANPFVQRAGLAALVDPEVAGYTAAWVRELAVRRRELLAGLNDLGWAVPAPPAGAFYAMADVRELAGRLDTDSLGLAHRILDETGVALTPGSDFGAGGEGFLRFSFAKDRADIAEAVRRLGNWQREVQP